MQPFMLKRRQAAYFIAGIIMQKGNYHCEVFAMKESTAVWLDVWTKAEFIPIEKQEWLGSINITLMGAVYTTNMQGNLRKEFLQLIPDALTIEGTLRDRHMAKEMDYGFQEEE